MRKNGRRSPLDLYAGEVWHSRFASAIDEELTQLMRDPEFRQFSAEYAYKFHALMMKLYARKLKKNRFTAIVSK